MRCKNFDDIKKPGDFMFSKDANGRYASITFMCPCGCDSLSGISITDNELAGSRIKSVWHWDGNLDYPTTKPSIRRLDGCKWHGYLTEGKFVAC